MTAWLQVVFDRKSTCAQHMHIQAFLCDRKLAPTTNKNLYRTLAEGLRVFSSLVVFPFSFCLVMLIHLDRCWKNNKRILTDNLLKTVIDNVSYNYILTLMQTWNMNVLFCNWTPWALANHIKTKTIRVHGGQQSKKKKKKHIYPFLSAFLLHDSSLYIRVP